MRKWRFQRGEVPVGCVVGMIFAAIVAMVAIKAVPEMTRKGEFQREVRILADKANRMIYNDKRILQEILMNAEKLEIPVTEKDVVIDRGRSRIVIEVKYTKPIEFPGYTYNWDVEIREDRPLF